MRILITGGTGFCGSWVVAEALRRGRDVVPVARAPAGADEIASSRLPAGADEIASSPLPAGPAVACAVLAADLEQEGCADALLDAQRPDAVIHLAALSDIGPCERDPVRARRVNTDVAGAIARACARIGARLVHVSTDQVFDGSRSGWRPEDAPCPIHAYGASKAAGEARVLEEDPGAVVVRPSLVTGPAPRGRRSATSWLLEHLARDSSPAMFSDEWRTPIAAQDLARALLDLTERDDVTGIVHCAGEQRLSRFELARLEAAAWGFEPHLVALGTRAHAGLAHVRPEDLSLDATGLWDALGWRPRVVVGVEV